jgi:4-alpha-glucanotransferase
MKFPRASGILLHPTSLPSRFGIGDLGESAYRFVDFLSKAKQSLWQILPLGPTGYGNSPYACYSAFAGNTLLISPERLVADGLLNSQDLNDPPAFSPTTVDYDRVDEFKHQLLARAFERFKSERPGAIVTTFAAFCDAESSWLDDYALFRALKDVNGGKQWNEWEQPFVRRESEAISCAQTSLADQIAAHKFYQFLFFRQWLELKQYCNERNIKLFGDIPIFVAQDSADVWKDPDQFKLDSDRSPIVVAGVPPDYFSKTGQLWGNPIYDWSRMQTNGFEWWIRRVEASLRQVDLVRIDHFRGFAACWEIPGGDKTAERGQWVAAPGRELFEAIRERLGDLPIVAEDLGVITPDVEALRDDFGFPGMRVLQFGFGGDAASLNLPHNYQANLAAYTGTHDNDTTVGWFGKLEPDTREFCLKYLDSDAEEINWDLIRSVYASVANMAVVPLQDVIGLGSEARMNLPNSTEHNWSWRFQEGELTAEMGARLRSLTEVYGRV